MTTSDQSDENATRDLPTATDAPVPVSGPVPVVYPLADLPYESLLGGALRRAALKGDHSLVNVIWIRPDMPYTPPHTHPEDQVTLILQGVAEMEIGGHKVRLEAPAAVHIPGNVPHTGVNVGDVDVLNIDIYGPGRADIDYLADHQVLWHLDGAMEA
jgi:mannose-6-phosphate isomerase-like protein (cupin superfamily)